MFFFHRPTALQIGDNQRALRDTPLSYHEQGCTRAEAVKGFTVDHHRVLLGYGSSSFERAKAALSSWKMFPPSMATLYWPDAPIETGTVVSVLFRAGPIWSLNSCRIIYCLDEDGATERFGFAYGTLKDHLECGEERFSVEWNHQDDSVWYDLRACSRPQHWAAYLGYPIIRFEQARFRKLSGQSMHWASSAD